MTPSRPALRYYGGKWRIAPWILSHFPKHVCYVEPFGGGASVLLQKEPSRIEVYNDLDGEVVAFFRVLRERPQDLIRAIKLTPYSREEYKAAWEPATDELERARRLYVRSRQGRGGCTREAFTGWRFQRTDNRGKSLTGDWLTVAHLEDACKRFLEVQIENDDALKVIERYDTPQTLFYVDPPYVTDTRYETARREYRHEMSDDDHRALAAGLQKIKGMVIVSGYPSELYQELYAGWRRVEMVTHTDSATAATECLWLSPSADARASSLRLPIGGVQ